MPCCIGEITIGNFKETFHMPIEHWSLKDYQQQWKDGLNRIKNHDRSCLISEIQDPKLAPWVSMWILYKANNKIFIRNEVLIDEWYTKTIGDKPFTLKTCYDFIDPRGDKFTEDGMEVSEWEIDLQDILDAANIMKTT